MAGHFTARLVATTPFPASVRLVNGASINEGRIEVYHEGAWGTVCDDNWDLQNGNVVCRQLGFTEVLRIETGATQFGSGTGDILLDNVNCKGTEATLNECAHSGWGVHNCAHSEDVGVVCSMLRATTPFPASVRLVNGASINEGRIEVYHEGAWGTVCDDNWDLQNGNVVCRQLGFTEALRIEIGATQFGSGTGDILLDDVNCQGTEATLNECAHSGWGVHNCVHSEDVGVVCSMLRVTTQAPTSLRLVDGPASSEGRLEIFYAGEWGSVCDDLWTFENAKVVCRQLGFAGAFRLEQGTQRYGQGTGPIHLDDVHCVGTESSLADCVHTGWGIHDCSHTEDVAVSCSDVGIRLVGGSSEVEGRVEVLYDGIWGSVCDDGWDLNEGMVVCRQLGFGIAVGAPTSAFFGESGGPILLDQVECEGQESKLTACNREPWGVHNCQHSEDAGVVCQRYKDTTELPKQEIRLVGGSSMFEGRVELFYNGEWGTICDDSWTIEDGQVACRQLGYGGVISVENEAFFGPGTGPILLDELECTGTEASLAFCVSLGWTNHNCGHSEDAGVVCDFPAARPTPAPHSLRLVGGPHPSEGRIEIYHNGIWGSVCDDGWDINEGNVVCRQLGYSRALRVEVDSFYWQSTEEIWLDDVTCSGVETGLEDCTHNGWGIHDCTHREDAGVVCQQGMSTEMPSVSVRLVGGSSPREGRVEIYVAGRWGTICARGWDLMDASVLCQQLGYGNAIRADGGASFGQGSGDILLDHVRCVGNEESLQECISDGADNHECDHAQDAGAVCSAATSSSNVRLVGGFTPYEGRIEIFHDGVWGTICDSDWDLTDALVICRQLGYIDATSTKDNAFYGQGSGPVFLANVECNGDETEISRCHHPGWYDVPSYCSHNRDAGVMCNSVSDDFVSVRLANQNNVYNTLEGRVEVYHLGAWGTVCGHNFDLNAGSVVCHQLGFAGASATRNFAYYGEGSGPIQLSNIDCRGDESNLGNCRHSEGNLEGCTHTDDAGVICLSTGSENGPFTHLEMIVAVAVVIFIILLLIVLVIAFCYFRRNGSADHQHSLDTLSRDDIPQMAMHRLRSQRPSIPNEYAAASFRRPSAAGSPYESSFPQAACSSYCKGDYEPMDGKPKCTLPKEPPPYCQPLGELPEYPPEYPPPPSPRPPRLPECEFVPLREGNTYSLTEEQCIYQEVDDYLVPASPSEKTEENKQ